MDPKRAALEHDVLAVSLSALRPNRLAVRVDDRARCVRSRLGGPPHARKNEEDRRRRALAAAAGQMQPMPNVSAAAPAREVRDRMRRAVAFVRGAREARPRLYGSGRPHAQRFGQSLQSLDLAQARWAHGHVSLEARSLRAGKAAIAHGFRLEEPGTRGGAHHFSPSSSARRSSRRAAWSRVHTVPMGTPSAAAISAQLSPSTSAISKVIRLASLIWTSALSTSLRACSARTRVGRRSPRRRAAPTEQPGSGRRTGAAGEEAAPRSR